MIEKAQLEVELARAHNALKAALLWHGAPTWSESQKSEWEALTGCPEATTKNLCDFIRKTLSPVPLVNDFPQTPTPTTPPTC